MHLPAHPLPSRARPAPQSCSSVPPGWQQLQGPGAPLLPGEKTLSEIGNHAYRYQNVLSEADKDLYIIQSLSHPAGGETEVLRRVVAAEPGRASRGQNPGSQAAVLPQGLPLPSPGLGMLFGSTEQALRRAQPPETQISAFSTSFSLRSATGLLSDRPSRPRRGPSFSQAAPRSLPVSGPEPREGVTSEQLY